MEIALHTGVHLTDKDHLVRCLMRNREVLAAQGIAVPGPGSYRHQLRQIAQDMLGRTVDAEMQETILDGFIEQDDARRVVFSSPDFIGAPRWAVGANRFYPSADEHVAAIAHLFPLARTTVYLALRDPVTFLPAMAADSRSGGVTQLLRDSDPAQLRWSEMILRILTRAPEVDIVVWRDEDTPLLWPEILREVAGHAPETELVGWFAWYWDLMEPKQHEAMRRWFGANPPVDDLHRRRILSAMLSRFARPEAVEAEALLPGWDEPFCDALSALYDEDIDLIAAMPRVRLLEP
ncbi:MAG: hypothetical protein Kow0013_14850 [Pararhodobacter sp.]